MDDCIFCKIVARAVSAAIIAETEDVIVIQDISPKATIHYLIIPKRHYKDLNEIDQCCVGSQMLQMARKISSENSNAKEYRLLVNNGYSVGQRVFHVHMHFLAGSRIPEF